jgi:hypothetical protein
MLHSTALHYEGLLSLHKYHERHCMQIHSQSNLSTHYHVILQKKLSTSNSTVVPVQYVM